MLGLKDKYKTQLFARKNTLYSCEVQKRLNAFPQTLILLQYLASRYYLHSVYRIVTAAVITTL